MNRMKAVLISVYTLVFVLFAAAIFYYGWKEGKRDEQEKDIVAEKKEEEGMIETEKGQEKEKEEEKEAKQEDVTAAFSGDIKIGKDTVYRVETYDIYTQKLVSEESIMPPQFLGMTRKDMESYWSGYVKDMPVEEFEQGLLSCDLTSFSREKITVRKTYDGSELKYRYFMILEQGCLIVYYSDKKTVFEDPEIFEEDLPAEEAEKLKKGVYVENEESLYSMLESYTS